MNAFAHRYKGSRLLEQALGAPPRIIYTVTVDDQPLPLTEPWARYGLDTFSWGFQSVGTEALAHAILSYELGEEIADWYFGDFAAQVISLLPTDGPGEAWTLDGDQVRSWVARQEPVSRS